MFHFYAPCKYQKPRDFWMFLGDVEVNHWPEIGKKLAIDRHQLKVIWRLFGDFVVGFEYIQYIFQVIVWLTLSV